MTGAAAPAPLPRVAWRPTFRRLRPERWLLAVGGAGWLTLVGLAVLGTVGRGHAHSGVVVPSTTGWGLHALGWLAMVAVMAPLAASNVRYAAIRSPARERGRVTVDVAAGYLLVWTGAAVLLGTGALLATRAVGVLTAIGLVTALAVVWQHSAVKRRSLTRCHRVVAPPLDRERSRRTCRRFGVRLGLDCAISCWPLMALMAVAGHGPVIAAGTVGVAWYERRRRPHHDPGTTETSLALGAIGATALALAVLTA